eukprot:2481261-Ditylum_brightwellii.AAC.2
MILSLIVFKNPFYIQYKMRDQMFCSKQEVLEQHRKRIAKQKKNSQQGQLGTIKCSFRQWKVVKL